MLVNLIVNLLLFLENIISSITFFIRKRQSIHDESLHFRVLYWDGTRSDRMSYKAAKYFATSDLARKIKYDPK